MKIALVNSSVELSNISLIDFIYQLVESEFDYIIFKALNWDASTLESFLLQLLCKSDLTCRKIIIHSQIETARHLGLTYVHLADQRVFESQKSHTLYSYTLDDRVIFSDDFDTLALRPTLFAILDTSSMATIEHVMKKCNWPVVAAYEKFLDTDLSCLVDFGVNNIAISIKSSNFTQINNCIKQLQAIGF